MFNQDERCRKCAASAPQPQLIANDRLRLTCHRCGHTFVRGTLDSNGRPNTISLLKAASDKTRERTVERVAQVIEGLKIKDVSPSVFKVLANHVRQVMAGHVGEMGGDVQ